MFYSFDIVGNEAVYDIELEVNDDNKCNFKLIDKVKNVETPTKGMLFSFRDELYIYYKSYAKQQGFRVVIKNTKKGCTWLYMLHHPSMCSSRQQKCQLK